MAGRGRRASPTTRRRDPLGAALLLAATPLLVCGAVAVALLLRRRRQRQRPRRPSRALAMRDGLGRYARGDETFSSLRTAIVGSAKAVVLSAFGPPRTALLGHGARRPSVWRAETWYYPLDRAARSAMAIRFQGNLVHDVEKISVPDVAID